MKHGTRVILRICEVQWSEHTQRRPASFTDLNSLTYLPGVVQGWLTVLYSMQEHVEVPKLAGSDASKVGPKVEHVFLSHFSSTSHEII